MLKIVNLKVSVDGKKEILKGIDLTVKPGQLHVLMGPNGSGKSTLAQAIMGNPSYTINDGRLTMDGKSLARLSADKRARLGLFMAFQHPVEIPGVSVFNVLRRARGPVTSFPPASARSRKSSRLDQQSIGSLRAVGSPATGTTPRSVSEFRQQLLEYASSLKLSDDFLRRSLNEGFSGGEKKRSEILQMMVLKPKLVILDEIDSGLDVDGLKLVAGAIKQFTVDSSRQRRGSPEAAQSSVLLITHYARVLKYLKPDFVHVMVDGRIVKSGRATLAKEIEEKGYVHVNR